MAKDAVIVVDMLKDNVNTALHTGISGEAQKIIPGLQRLLAEARAKSLLVVYANDSFYATDIIFRGKMKPHALRGTSGVQVIGELEPETGDIILEKRRMSAFFKTDLDITLRDNGVERVAVAGITTPFCVLLTAMDAFCNGFKTVIIEDCCTAYQPDDHQNCLNLYRKGLFGDYFRIVTAEEYLSWV
ncbi:MAG: cysteine hydrolase [Peptococcaceae bacterium]|nr:cysteine hydrolase [Peptococcaceae bacterium]